MLDAKRHECRNACRGNTRALKASGAVLTHLRASLDGQLFSSIVWRFALDPAAGPAAGSRRGALPAAVGDGESAAAASTEQKEAELPYHRCYFPFI